MSAWQDMKATLWPGRDAPDGRLAPLLVALTVVTGMVDAASFLGLGHVFVANMTGNVVFLGFAIAGASGLSAWASLTALGAFLAGSLAGGRIAGALRPDRSGLLLVTSLSAQLGLFVAAVVVAASGGHHLVGVRQYAEIALLAWGMGLQNSTVRRLAVPELTTTVLTMTLTGIASDSTLAGGTDSKIGRRSLAVAAMFLGALTGALLALKVDTFAALGAATGLLAVITLAAYRLTARPLTSAG